jgi:O-antigen/teichoic acid export membrane protein
MTNYSKKLVKGTGLIFIAAIFAAGLGYLLRILLAKNLSIEAYGLFYAVFAFIGILASFRTFGMGQSLIKFIPEFKLQKRFSLIKSGIVYYFLIQFIIFVIMLFVLFLFAEKLALFYFKDINAIGLLILLGLAFLFAIFESLFHVLFLGYSRSSYYSFTTFFQMFLVVIITFILFELGIGYLSPAYGYLFASIIAGIVYFILFKNLSPEFFKAKLCLNSKLFKKLFLFGLPLTASAIVASSVGYIDTLILTYFTTLKDVALYHVALPIAMLLRYFTKSVSLIIIPLSSEIYLKSKDLLVESVKKIQKYLLIVIIPLALVMAIFAPNIISLLFGKDYLGAVTALRILSVSAIFYSVAHVNSNLLLGIGKSTSNAKIMASGSIIALILNLILIPFYGVLGAAISVLIASLFIFVLSAIYLRKTIEYKIPFVLFFKLFILGFGFLIVLNSLRVLSFSNLFVKFSIIGLIGIISYFVGLVMLNIVNLEELKLLFNRIR